MRRKDGLRRGNHKQMPARPDERIAATGAASFLRILLVPYRVVVII